VDSFGPHHRPPQIVGECADVRDVNPATAAGPTLYIPLRQIAVVWRPSLLVRTRTDPASLADPVRAAIRAVDAQATVTQVESLPTSIASSTRDRTFQTTALAALAGLGLLVGLIGISGVVAFAMADRAREFGVRTALGARPVDLARLVLRESALAIAGGLAVGALVALDLTRFLRSVLFELSATDPTTFLGVVVLLAGASSLTYLLPVRRVARASAARVLDADSQ
jgi:putative ABC transport system permease protein